MAATSGSNPMRMTSLQYGTNVAHVIRGVQVSGGSCTVGPMAADASPVDYEITSAFTFTPSSARTFLMGGDYSRLNMQLQGGASYKEGGVTKDAIDIAVDNGWNIVRLRVFNDPGNKGYSPSSYMSPGFVNKADALRLAAKAKAAGMEILLTFHYSDYWTNPGVQNIPHDWNGKNFNQLKAAIYDFTKDVLDDMNAQGTLPAYVSIGNETNSGLLFGGGTEGTNYNSYNCDYEKYVAFFNQGAQAVRDVSSAIKVVTHLTSPNGTASYVLGQMNTYEADYDVIGISYYPFWTETMMASDFCSQADSWASTYGKDVLIMETAVNWNTITYYGDAGQLTNQGAYESIYPASAENQRNYLQEIINQIKMSDSVIGLIYWDPVTVKLSTWNYTYYGTSGTISNYDNGTINQNAALFDFNGNRLPAWDAFKYNN